MDKFELFNKAKELGYSSKFIGEHPIEHDEEKEGLRYFLFLCELGYWINITKLKVDETIINDLEDIIDKELIKLKENETK